MSDYILRISLHLENNAALVYLEINARLNPNRCFLKEEGFTVLLSPQVI